MRTLQIEKEKQLTPRHIAVKSQNTGNEKLKSFQNGEKSLLISYWDSELYQISQQLPYKVEENEQCF